MLPSRGSKATIVVTTPTGSIGRRLLQILIDAGAAVRVIARDPSRVPSQTRPHVEVVEGSHGDFEIVNRAFEGASSALWIPPPSPRAESVEAAYVGFTQPACEALRRGRQAGCQRLGPWPRAGFRTWCHEVLKPAVLGS